MLTDSDQFTHDTSVKARYTIPLDEVEFIVEQHDEIAIHTRILWSTLYDKDGALFCKYTSPVPSDIRQPTYMVFSHTNLAKTSIDQYFKDGLESYRCTGDESLYQFDLSNNYRTGDGLPGWAFMGVLSGACVTSAGLNPFGIKMKHMGGFKIDLSYFQTYRATHWSPGEDPNNGGGWGCTDIWFRTNVGTKHVDLRGQPYGTLLNYDVTNLPNEDCALSFEYN